MTIFFFTGFEGCSDSYMMRSIFDRYKVSSGGQDFILRETDGYQSSKCIYTTKYCDWWKNVPAGNKTIVTGGHWIGFGDGNGSYSSSGYYYRRWFIFVVGNTQISIIHRVDTGLLYVYNGDTLLGSASLVLDKSLHHYEVKVFSNATTGFVQLKEDGRVVATISGINTDGGDISMIGWASNDDYAYIDNIYIADEFQGELYSKILRPTSDGDSSDFTPSAGGDNFAMIDEVTQDVDSTIVQSNVVDDTDLYGYEDYNPTDVDIKGVFISTHARKTSGVGRIIQQISKQDLTERGHSSIILGLSYPYIEGQGLCDFFDKCPDGTDWTFTKLNAIQWGFKVAS